jgi:hypothetical protein
MATRKPPKSAKKKSPKTEKRDFSQVAFFVVEQVTGAALSAGSVKPTRKR